MHFVRKYGMLKAPVATKGTVTPMNQSQLDQLFLKTLAFFRQNPAQVQHLMKVHGFAAKIGRLERLPDGEQFILEAAALVHDVGIPPAEEKYGSCSGKLQEQEGPPVARKLLSSLGFPPEVTERVAYLVGHHHTYTEIDGMDYRILVEADFLVNLYDGNTPKEQIESTGKKIFQTQTGKQILSEMFGIHLA